MSQSVKIQLNGENVSLASVKTVSELIDHYQLSPKKLAVELNFSILPRDQYSHVILQNGDLVEIVEFVGGG